jgi:hypothetical protein
MRCGAQDSAAAAWDLHRFYFYFLSATNVSQADRSLLLDLDLAPRIMAESWVLWRRGSRLGGLARLLEDDSLPYQPC